MWNCIPDETGSTNDNGQMKEIKLIFVEKNSIYQVFWKIYFKITIENK